MYWRCHKGYFQATSLLLATSLNKSYKVSPPSNYLRKFPQINYYQSSNWLISRLDKSKILIKTVLVIKMRNKKITINLNFINERCCSSADACRLLILLIIIMSVHVSQSFFFLCSLKLCDLWIYESLYVLIKFNIIIVPPQSVMAINKDSIFMWSVGNKIFNKVHYL